MKEETYIFAAWAVCMIVVILCARNRKYQGVTVIFSILASIATYLLGAVAAGESLTEIFK